jgi:hypothetical protein
MSIGLQEPSVYMIRYGRQHALGFAGYRRSSMMPPRRGYTVNPKMDPKMDPKTDNHSKFPTHLRDITKPRPPYNPHHTRPISSASSSTSSSASRSTSSSPLMDKSSSIFIFRDQRLAQSVATWVTIACSNNNSYGGRFQVAFRAPNYYDLDVQPGRFLEEEEEVDHDKDAIRRLTAAALSIDGMGMSEARMVAYLNHTALTMIHAVSSNPADRDDVYATTMNNYTTYDSRRCSSSSLLILRGSDVGFTSSLVVNQSTTVQDRTAITNHLEQLLLTSSLGSYSSSDDLPPRSDSSRPQPQKKGIGRNNKGDFC